MPSITQDPEFSSWPKDKQLYYVAKERPDLFTDGDSPEMQNHLIQRYINDHARPKPGPAVQQPDSSITHNVGNFLSHAAAPLTALPGMMQDASNDFNPVDQIMDAWKNPSLDSITNLGLGTKFAKRMATPIVNNLVKHLTGAYNAPTKLDALSEGVKAIPILGQSMETGEKMFPKSGPIDWSQGSSLSGDLVASMLPKLAELAPLGKLAPGLKNGATKNMLKLFPNSSFAEEESLAPKMAELQKRTGVTGTERGFASKMDNLVNSEDANVQRLNARKASLETERGQRIDAGKIKQEPLREAISGQLEYDNSPLDPGLNLNDPNYKPQSKFQGSATRLDEARRSMSNDIRDKFSKLEDIPNTGVPNDTQFDLPSLDPETNVPKGPNYNNIGPDSKWSILHDQLEAEKRAAKSGDLYKRRADEPRTPSRGKPGYFDISNPDIEKELGKEPESFKVRTDAPLRYKDAAKWEKALRDGLDKLGEDKTLGGDLTAEERLVKQTIADELKRQLESISGKEKEIPPVDTGDLENLTDLRDKFKAGVTPISKTSGNRGMTVGISPTRGLHSRIYQHINPMGFMNTTGYNTGMAAGKTGLAKILMGQGLEKDLAKILAGGLVNDRGK